MGYRNYWIIVNTKTNSIVDTTFLNYFSAKKRFDEIIKTMPPEEIKFYKIEKHGSYY